MASRPGYDDFDSRWHESAEVALVQSEQLLGHRSRSDRSTCSGCGSHRGHGSAKRPRSQASERRYRLKSCTAMRCPAGERVVSDAFALVEAVGVCVHRLEHPSTGRTAAASATLRFGSPGYEPSPGATVLPSRTCQARKRYAARSASAVIASPATTGTHRLPVTLSSNAAR